MSFAHRQRCNKRSWLRSLVFIYGITFCFLLVAASVTAYVLSHPELGLKEKDPITRACISNYGLIGGLVLVNLYNSAMILLFWPFFILYLILRRKYKRNNILADSIAYSGIAAYGMYQLISWMLNAASDVSWLLFYSCPYVITATWDLWMDLPFHLVVAIFVALLPGVYYLMRRSKCMHGNLPSPFRTQFLQFYLLDIPFHRRHIVGVGLNEAHGIGKLQCTTATRRFHLELSTRSLWYLRLEEDI